MITNVLDQKRMDAFAQLSMLRSAIATIAPEDRELTVIDEMMAKLHSRQYIVAVVGEFNRGKSSLINALLGMNVLPADITPTTATINRVVYSDVPYSRLHMLNGQVEEIPLTMLKGRVTKLSQEVQSAAEQVEEAVIGYPTVFCRNNISILDTPGLNESEDMDALTFERTQQADALIYTIHALIPFSTSEAKAVCRLLEYPNIRHILFTVGFIDQVPADEHERMLTLIRKRILKHTDRLIDEDTTLDSEEAERRKAIIHQAVVLGISAKMALDAFVNGSIEQLQASGIEAYKKALMTRLTAQQDEWVAFEILPYLKKTASTFGNAAQRSLQGLDARIQITQTALSAARSLLETLPTEAIRAGLAWENGLIQQIGSSEECSQKLRALIQAKQEQEVPQKTNEETPLVNEFHRSVSNGLSGWIKQKVKETGLYRDNSDPRIHGIEIGFNVAKLTIAEDWKPQINAAAQMQYADFQRTVERAAQQALEHIHTAAEALSQMEKQLPDMLWKPAESDRIDLLYDEHTQELYNVQTGNLTIGSVNFVIQHLAKTLADKLYAIVTKRMEEIKRPVLLEAYSAKTKGIELLVPLETALEKLRQQRNELQGQIESIRKFLLGAHDESFFETNEPAVSTDAEQNNLTEE